MNTLVVYSHPHDRSHNRRILDAVLRGLRAGGAAHEVLDLYGSRFDPRLKRIEYERWFITMDPEIESDVKETQARMAAARNLVFVYPVWWFTMPAVLKGFVDRVFAPGFAYRFRRYNGALVAVANALSRIPGVRYLMQPHVARGLLAGKRAYIFRTYGGPALSRRVFGDTPSVLENGVLRFCGITDITIRELYGLNLPTHKQAREDRYLRKVEQIAKGIRND